MSASIATSGNRSRAHLMSLGALAALLSCAVQPGIAQTPEQAGATSTAAGAVISASAEAPARPRARRIGDATSDLLRMQADGSAAGAPLPMLGATADPSWQRYLNSFKHPIPEFFGNEIQPIGHGH
jgi:hypothetical protein